MKRLGHGKDFQVFFLDGTYIIQFWTQFAFEGLGFSTNDSGAQDNSATLDRPRGVNRGK